MMLGGLLALATGAVVLGALLLEARYLS